MANKDSNRERTTQIKLENQYREIACKGILGAARLISRPKKKTTSSLNHPLLARLAGDAKPAGA